jgi:hypothetical protein
MRSSNNQSVEGIVTNYFDSYGTPKSVHFRNGRDYMLVPGSNTNKSVQIFIGDMLSQVNDLQQRNSHDSHRIPGETHKSVIRALLALEFKALPREFGYNSKYPIYIRDMNEF